MIVLDAVPHPKELTAAIQTNPTYYLPCAYYMDSWPSFNIFSGEQKASKQVLVHTEQYIIRGRLKAYYFYILMVKYTQKSILTGQHTKMLQI